MRNSGEEEDTKLGLEQTKVESGGEPSVRRDEDVELAKLNRLCFLPLDAVRRFWKIQFPSGPLAETPKLSEIKDHGLHVTIVQLPKQTIFVFQPVEGFSNWPRIIFDVELKPFENALVHEGALLALSPHFAKLDAVKGKRLYTGMSFGGVFAQIYNLHYPAPTVTFGSMRVGREIPLGPKNYVNRGDIVPSIPSNFDKPVGTVDAGDCSANCTASVWCHAKYLGVDFAVVDVVSRLIHFLSKHSH